MVPAEAGGLIARAIGAAVDSGRVPERVLRAAIRRICAARLRDAARGAAAASAGPSIGEPASPPIAVATDASRAQHYEVPAAFFRCVLGPRLKYSGCYWPPGVDTLGEAEEEMLELTAARAELRDGQRVLDLGCGWGALTLWAAARFPRSQVVGLSHARSQAAYIRAAAKAAGLGNVEVVTRDVGEGLGGPSRAPGLGTFDRIVSVEMLEHVRDHAALLRELAGLLREDGRLFVHVFAHRRWAYPFEDEGPADWMAREFFTGGMMPSARTVPDAVARLGPRPALALAEAWFVDGTHYARTAEAWLANLRARRAEAEAVLGSRVKVERWRVFFLACAELFGFRAGEEWGVRHYLMRTAG